MLQINENVKENLDSYANPNVNKSNLNQDIGDDSSLSGTLSDSDDGEPD